MKPGRVCIVLNGRQAGKKCVITQNFDKGTTTKKFPLALVAGIQKYPLTVTKSMSKKKLARRSKIKTFIKYVNYNHLLPTRYIVNSFNLEKVKLDNIKEKDAKFSIKKEVKQEFEKQYL